MSTNETNDKQLKLEEAFLTTSAEDIATSARAFLAFWVLLTFENDAVKILPDGTIYINPRRRAELEEAVKAGLEMAIPSAKSMADVYQKFSDGLTKPVGSTVTTYGDAMVQVRNFVLNNKFSTYPEGDLCNFATVLSIAKP